MPVNPARYSESDNVVVIAPFTKTSHVSLFTYVIRTALWRLGSDWSLQIYYGSDAEHQVEALLVCLGLSKMRDRVALTKL